MKKVLSILVVNAVLILYIASGALAAESKDRIKGSFRNPYPNAIVVDTAVVYNAETVSRSTSSLPDDHLPVVYRKLGEAAVVYSVNFCKNKSTYSIADNYEVHTTQGSTGTMLFVSDFNVICFNLPETPLQSPQKKN